MKLNFAKSLNKAKKKEKSDILFADRNCYVGLSFLDIIEFHKDRKYSSTAIAENKVALEIRFDRSTLTCFLEKNICSRAMEMYDADTITEIVLGAEPCLS